MSESMIERVARAICTAHGEFPDTETPYNPHVSHLWQHYIPSARAAIEAMRTPTEAMEEAAHYGEAPGEPNHFSEEWEQAIDAALQEQKP